MASGSYGLRLVVVGLVTIGAAAGLSMFGIQQQKLAAAEASDLSLYEAAQTRQSLQLTSRTAAAEGEVERGSVVGRFVPARQLLVPHQLSDGRKGYDLWLALEYTPGTGGMNGAGEFVIVNRGWIDEAARADAARYVVPDAEGNYEGYWISMPLGGENEVSREFCLDPAWPKTLTNPVPSFGDMKCLFNSQQIAQGLMLLTSDLGDGLVRDWVGLRQAAVKRHQMMAYGAFGGAGLAVLLLLLFAILGRPKAAAPAPAPAPAAAAHGDAGHREKHPHAPMGKLNR